MSNRNSTDFWLQKITDNDTDYVRQQIDKEAKKTEEYIRLALEIDEKKQEGITNASREQREYDMEKHARHSKWAVLATIPISLSALVVSIWAAFFQKG